MPDNTNPVAIAFCNNFARRAADKRAQDYYFAKATVAEWNALGGATLIPNSATEVIRDSANPVTGTGDGRPQLTGDKVNALITRCQEIIADFDATSSAKLNTVLQVSPNPFAT